MTARIRGGLLVEPTAVETGRLEVVQFPGVDPPRVRPGMAIGSLSAGQLGLMFAHPAHESGYRTVTELIVGLRNCLDPADFYEFQTVLFRRALEADNRRAECVRIVKRLRGNRGLPSDAPEPPATGDEREAEAWEFEAFVYERLFRQVRAVGDGLAWRVFNYDRSVIAALGSNQSPGPLVKRAGAGLEGLIGLKAEVAAVDAAWSEQRKFALLHDLTNCLRIGDATEVHEDFFQVREVKANSDNRGSGAQVRRMREAVRSIVGGAPLPGKGMRVVQLTEPYVTDLGALADVIRLSYSHGVRGAQLGRGRAIVATSFPGLGKRCGDDLSAATAVMNGERSGALRRAGLEGTVNFHSAMSRDYAARVPLLAPWTIFPFSPAECAALTCDIISFESILSRQRLADSLEDEGLIVELLPLDTSRPLDNHEPCMRVISRTRQMMMTMYPNDLMLMLFELVRPESWARGVAELFARPIPFENPWYRLSGDTAPWVP